MKNISSDIFKVVNQDSALMICFNEGFVNIRDVNMTTSTQYDDNDAGNEHTDIPKTAIL